MKLTRLVAGAAFALALSGAAAFAASQFEGTWKTQDTEGNPFQITLSQDGSAKGDRADEGLSGSWKEKDNAAVINWDTGWTTKIAKDGNQYKKMAYEKGQDAMGEPAHTTSAEKVQ